MQLRLSRIGKYLLFLAPFVLGAIGLIALEGEPVLDSLFSCVSLYIMGYQNSPPNLLVELARWTAPLATASGLLLAISAMRNLFRSRIRYLRGNSVAVYGPRELRETLLARLGRRGIDGGDAWALVPAQSYLLRDEEAKNFDFYAANREKLTGSP